MYTFAKLMNGATSASLSMCNPSEKMVVAQRVLLQRTYQFPEIGSNIRLQWGTAIKDSTACFNH
jgi:hypothetical protein